MAQFNTLGTATRTRVEVVNAFMRGVYHWMALGLIVTAVLSYVTAHTPALLSLVINAETGSPTLLFWGLLIGELIMVMAIAGAINKLSAATASGLFCALQRLERRDPVLYFPGVHPGSPSFPPSSSARPCSAP